MLVAVAIPAGLLIGLSLGALGGGGSILTVPALVYLLHQHPRAATTGSLLIVGITALAGAVVHWRAGRVRVLQGITFGVLGIGGAYAGSRLSAAISPDLLLALFGVLMLGVAAMMIRRRAKSATTSVAPARRDLAGGLRAGEMLTIVAVATGVGLLTGFFGVGGGFVIVPALVLALRFDMAVAVGTSLLVIAVNSGAALAARLGGGVHLDWPVIGVFTLAALAGTLGGTRIAARVSPAKLSVAFTLLLAAVATYTLARSVPALG